MRKTKGAFFAFQIRSLGIELVPRGTLPSGKVYWGSSAWPRSLCTPCKYSWVSCAGHAAVWFDSITPTFQTSAVHEHFTDCMCNSMCAFLPVRGMGRDVILLHNSARRSPGKQQRSKAKTASAGSRRGLMGLPSPLMCDIRNA